MCCFVKFRLHVLNCLREVCLGNITRVRVYGVQLEVARQCVCVCVCVCVCIDIYIYIYICL